MKSPRAVASPPRFSKRPKARRPTAEEDHQRPRDALRIFYRRWVTLTSQCGQWKWLPKALGKLPVALQKLNGGKAQGRRTRGGCGCFNTHTFPDERVQHPHFFCSFYAVLHKRLTAVAPRFLWPLCVWECARCGCLLSPPSQTWHRLWVWPADDWLFCLKSRLSWYVRFIGQLVLRRRELMVMVIYISLFQVLWMSVYAFEFFK